MGDFKDKGISVHIHFFKIISFKCIESEESNWNSSVRKNDQSYNTTAPENQAQLKWSLPLSSIGSHMVSVLQSFNLNFSFLN